MEKNENKNKFSYLEIIKSSGLFVGLMIFLSFFQVYTLYKNFDIPIYAYTTTYELIFYFIPYFLINYLAILVKYWYIFLLVGVFFYSLELLNIKWFKDLKELICDPKKKLIFKEKWKVKNYKRFKCLYHFFSILVISIVLACILRIITSLLLPNESYKTSFIIDQYLSNFIDNISPTIIYGKVIIHKGIYAMWCLWLYIYLLRVLKKYKPENSPLISFNLLFLIFILFTFSSIKTTENISKIKQKKSDYVIFLYEGDTVKTDTNRIYIGGTKDYLFIKNFNGDTNETYNMNNVRFLKEKKYKDTFDNCK